MNAEINWTDPAQPFFYIEDVLGEILNAEQLSDGIYRIYAVPEGETVGTEYYLGMKGAPELSAKAKQYAQEVNGIYAYPTNDYFSGWKIVEYEMYRYLKAHGKPLPNGESLLETAVYAMEYHPEYFGEYPVPLDTPHGRTVRHQILENGIFWLETDQCEELLAVCYPIWQCEFSRIVKETGEQTEHDRKAGIDQICGYLFFTRADSCIAIFELMKVRTSWEGYRIRKDALMNAIWNRFPKYAFGNNLMVRRERQPETKTEQMVWISQDAGEDFLLWDEA